MSEQLELIAAEPKLTDRQRRALQIIAERQPILSGDLGQALGAHPDYQTTSGNAVATALRNKGLTKYSRKYGGWITTGYMPPSRQTNDIPF